MFVFRTVIWGTIFLIAALMIGPWLALQFDASFPPIAIGWLRYVGIAMCVIGIPLSLYCAIIIITPGTSRPAPYDAGGTFTVAGPYLYMRNPFMLGVILSLWGEAILLMRIVMIAYAFILTWVIYFWVIFFEEPALTEGLGNEYLRYKKAVPRWFPQFRKYKG
jgi:protein-S-isoprenylcysteine O-methyltransferase Ste14